MGSGRIIKQSYVEAAKNGNIEQRGVRQRVYNSEEKGRRQGSQQQQRRIECWTCHEEGHVSRDCRKRLIKCFACGVQGHIRRDCPNVRCRRCDRNGHQEKDCYTNLNRQMHERTNQGNFRNKGNDGYDRNRGYNINVDYRSNGEYRRNGGYQGNTENRRTGEQGMKDRRYVANMEEDRSENGEQRYPNADASTEVEIVGAIF